MRKILFLIVLLAVVALVGVERGWFQVASAGDQSKVTVTVDKDKIREDEGKALEKVHEAKDKAIDAVNKVK